MTRRGRWTHGLLIAWGGISALNCGPQEDERSMIDRFSVRRLEVSIGGQPAVELNRAQFGTNRPQLLSARILPGRGMNIYQLTAWLPGRGVVDLLEAPTLEQAAALMDGGPDDFIGNASFKVGGAILVPFANRIRGRYLAESRLLETTLSDRTVRLPANWKGRQDEAEPHAMHGLILDKAFQLTSETTDEGAAKVTGLFSAGDFDGHWPSRTEITVEASLEDAFFQFDVTAKNVGDAPLPMAIGWHPYFRIPGGDRRQARLFLPAARRALVTNYDDVFPTGELVAVDETLYDFNDPGGKLLGELFLDDCFTDLDRSPDGTAISEIIDPQANYGIRITALSPEIKAVQVYAPVDRAFVALEPQFNLADPYAETWPDDVDTGMVILEPGESVRYSVRIELFVP